MFMPHRTPEHFNKASGKAILSLHNYQANCKVQRSQTCVFQGKILGSLIEQMGFKGQLLRDVAEAHEDAA